MEAKKKDKPTLFRFSEDDGRRLAELAIFYEVSQAQVVRMLIKRDWEALLGPAARR